MTDLAQQVCAANHNHKLLVQVTPQQPPSARSETMALGSLANAIRRLLEDSACWDELVADPALIPSAIDETLRFDPSVPAWRRVTTRPILMGGVALPEGAKLFLWLAAAGRDSSVFDLPDEFDPHRRDARLHLELTESAAERNPRMSVLGIPNRRLWVRPSRFAKRALDMIDECAEITLIEFPRPTMPKFNRCIDQAGICRSRPRPLRSVEL